MPRIIIFGLIGVVLFTLSLFLRTAGHDFVYDDYLSVETNLPLQQNHSLLFFIKHPEAAWATGVKDAGGIYRPFGLWLLSLEYALFGNEPGLFHIVSALLHAINILLLFFLIRMLFRQDMLALAVAGLFGVHPVTIEAVAWITQQPTLWALMFGLLSSLTFVAFVEGHIFIYAILSSIFLLLSLFTKEQIFFLPLLFPLFVWIKGVSIKRAWFPVFIAGGISAIYLVTRIALLGAPVQQAAPWGGSYYTASLTMIRGFFHYIRLSLVPYPLTVDYDTFGISRSITDWRVLGALAIFLFIGVGIYFLRHRHKEAWHTKAVILGVAWFLGMLLPVSNVVTPLREIINERFLYFALPGILLAAIAWSRVVLCASFSATPAVASEVFGLFAQPPGDHQEVGAKPKRPTNPLRGLLCSSPIFLVFLIFSFLTFQRLGDWENGITLWRSAVGRDPFSSRSQHNFGIALDRASDPQALKHYESAFVLAEKGPARERERVTLAWGYLRAGRIADARLLVEKAYAEKPDDDQLAFVYGTILLEEQRFKEAAAAFSHLAELYPYNQNRFFALLSAYLADEKNTAGEPYDSLIKARLLMLDDAWGDAAVLMEEVLRTHRAPTPFIFLWWGEALERVGDTEAAETAYEIAYQSSFTAIQASQALKRLK